jgi:hypothetical protein
VAEPSAFHLLLQRLLGLGQVLGHQRPDLLQDRDLLGLDARLDLGVDPVAGHELLLEHRVVPDRADVGGQVAVAARTAGERGRGEQRRNEEPCERGE